MEGVNTKGATRCDRNRRREDDNERNKLGRWPIDEGKKENTD
jgi:hypothetical protein